MPSRRSFAGGPKLKRAPVWRPDWAGLASGGILAAATIAVYGRTFSVPLLLDDSSAIADNASIRHLWALWPVLAPPGDAGVGGRPLLNLSYALNYAFGGTAVWGYHAVNLAIHLLAALALFGLVRRTLATTFTSKHVGENPYHPTMAAFFVALLWAVHPLQTEAVTYLSQRAESLMGLFYLLTLYCFARGAGLRSVRVGSAAAISVSPPQSPKGGKRWFALSVLACLAGVATKEVAVTAPVMVLLYDRTFVSGSFSGAWRRHGPVHSALAATWIPLGCLLAGLHGRGVGFGGGVAWWAYGLTECRAMVRYLSLVFWPHPLIFDYGGYEAAGLSAVWLDGLVLAALLVATAWALLRGPRERGAVRLRPWGFGGQALGFAGAWFFLILAPTSSIVPIVGQPMAENRLYLPLAGIVALVVLGAVALTGRRSFSVLAAVAVALGLAAAQRNRDYSSEQAIWSDTVAKNPANPRAHNNLGLALENSPDQLTDAIAQFEEAVRLKPDLAEAHNNLGNAWLSVPGRLDDSIAQFEAALRLKPDYAEAHNNLGNAWAAAPGRLPEAIAQFEAALRLKPDYAEAHNNLGSAWFNLPGRLDDAIAQYQAALRLRPDYAEAHNNLGNAWSEMPGRSNEAIAQFEEALRLKPDYAEAHNNLGSAWFKTPGRLDDAIAQYGEAVRLKPDFAEAHNNLGSAWFRMPGRLNDAIAQYEEAVRLKPDFVEAHFSLGNAWLKLPGRLNDAIAQYRETVRLKPDFAPGWRNLGVSWVRLGNLPAAVEAFRQEVRLAPNDPEARHNLATALRQSQGH